MSQMLPEGAPCEEVMRRVACGDVCPTLADPSTLDRSSPLDNKELLRQQLLSAEQSKAEVFKAKPSRSRQKNRWKLKFHHQALPQEYLDHYEQSLQKANANKSKPKPIPEKLLKTENFDNNSISNDALKMWTQRLAGISSDIALPLPLVQLSNPVLNMAPPQASKSPKTEVDKKKKHSPAIAPSKIVTYDDLPYMGEMTLNNSKPRRGRKPKKADICHLIYENYGTVVPGQPSPNVDTKLTQLSMCPPYRTTNHSNHASRTNLQNKIISSLLEKKISQESKRRSEQLTPRFAPNEPLPEAPLTIAGPLHSDSEPLNLCIRDLHELKLQIQKKFGNIYSSLPEVKTEPDPEKVEDGNGSEQPNAISVIQRNTNLSSPSTTSSSPELTPQPIALSPTLSEPIPSTATPDGDGKFPYMLWPDAGVYMHPLALQTQLLYYQRLAEENSRRLTFDNQVVSPAVDDSKNKLVLKQISDLLDPRVIKQAEEPKLSSEQPKMKRSSPKPSPQTAVKRKRSAIFIPPVPVRTNSTTPTTEVSICKFKFTGGSKPSLQEKKMLSVDSGGNFRYYSGTGSKANKGSDSFSREPEQDKSLANASDPLSRLDSPQGSSFSLNKDLELNKKKRKSRKSLQREKLEQTFKEKGFLIQTQQLQSAEGATYCKFRQLRKFTRYLFRSWKDYLPGELDEGRRRPEDGQTSEAPVAGEWG